MTQEPRLSPIALPSFVLGYHGCDQEVGENVLAGRKSLVASRNSYDWLGHGMYFWEHNAGRALAWAREIRDRGGSISKPYVIGAIIDLGLCLNLLAAENLEFVQVAYASYVEATEMSGIPLPVNR